MIAQDEEILSLVTHRFAHTVLTPHAAEAARILRLPVEEITKDRLSRALDLGILTGAVNVLKGAGTIVTQRSSVSWINPTGSPALATAGSGDALSGMIGAMFAQHFELMDCVLSAVYLHGAAVEGLNSSVLAGDIAPLASTRLEELRASYQRHFHPLKEEEKTIEWEDS
jgi:NAD(P)H-hydrate repair Nnr-like enzyme with NAD(P)H-hydrate dehydratase domain